MQIDAGLDNNNGSILKNMTMSAWKKNWFEEIVGAVHALGYSSLAEYAMSRPGMTYHQLGEELGAAAVRTFAPVQVECALRDHAIETGEIEDFTRTSLVRHLRHLMPDGWSKSDVFPSSHAVGAWSSRLPKDYRKRCAEVGKILVASPLPEGWLPEDCTDEILTRAFEEAEVRCARRQAGQLED